MLLNTMFRVHQAAVIEKIRQKASETELHAEFATALRKMEDVSAFLKF